MAKGSEGSVNSNKLKLWIPIVAGSIGIATVLLGYSSDWGGFKVKAANTADSTKEIAKGLKECKQQSIDTLLMITKTAANTDANTKTMDRHFKEATQDRIEQREFRAEQREELKEYRSDVKDLRNDVKGLRVAMGIHH